MHISSVPDLCLLLMFEKLDLNNLYRATQVCRRWRSLRSLACKQRRSLDICLEKDLKENRNCFKDLTIVAFNDDHTKRIIAQFPNVHVLLIENLNYEENTVEFTSNIILGMALFLSNPKWNQLISLKLEDFLDYEFLDYELRGPYDSLVKSINSLTALKHLVLEDAIYPSFLSGITIFPQLKDLTISVCSSLFIQLVDFMVSLQTPKQFASLKEIKLNVYDVDEPDDSVDLHRLLQMHPAIASKVTSMNFLSEVLWNPSLFSRYCAHFPSIREAEFDIYLDGFWLPELFDHLEKLKELQRLSITLRDHNFSKDSDVLQLKPVPSLERLTVILSSDISTQQASLNMFTRLYVSRTFCNITQLYIEYFTIHCNVCRIRLDKVSDAQFRMCVHHLIEPFKRCQRLQKIEMECKSFQIPVQNPEAKKYQKNNEINKCTCVIRAPFENIETAFW